MLQNIIEVLILSAIQGISEFLPISSSAHLILVSSLYEFKSSSLLIDISLHLGSLFAILYYFRMDLLDVKNNKRLLSLIVVGSIPLIIFGYVLYSTGIIYELRNVKIIAWTTLIFAIVLFFERINDALRSANDRAVPVCKMPRLSSSDIVFSIPINPRSNE